MLCVLFQFQTPKSDNFYFKSYNIYEKENYTKHIGEKLFFYTLDEIFELDTSMHAHTRDNLL